jgi:HAD superfamily hydrolase (TIGR01509 family)
MGLIIFDCDGVLVDSEVIAHALLAAKAVQKFAGRSLVDTLSLLEASLGRSIPDDLGQRYGRLLLERLGRDLKPIASVKATIAALPYRRCVASSSSLERIRLSLQATGLASLFDANIFSATQVAHGKPAPDLYLLASIRMGIAPEHCVVVEDSTIGVKAARAARMKVIGFTRAAHATPDAARRLAAAGAGSVVSSMVDLPATVERSMSDAEIPR